MKASVSFATAAFAVLAVAQPSFARRGGDGDVVARGTQAWFLYESAEELASGLVANGTITEADVVAADVTLNGSDSDVVLTVTGGDLAESCWMAMTSRGGTRADVRCGSLPESRTDLTRGSKAWTVVEGLEHALRLAATEDVGTLASVVGGSSAVDGAGTVLVELRFEGGATWDYVCTSRRTTSLNCARTR